MFIVQTDLAVIVLLLITVKAIETLHLVVPLVFLSQWLWWKSGNCTFIVKQNRWTRSFFNPFLRQCTQSETKQQYSTMSIWSYWVASWRHSRVLHLVTLWQGYWSWWWLSHRWRWQVALDYSGRLEYPQANRNYSKFEAFR